MFLNPAHPTNNRQRELHHFLAVSGAPMPTRRRSNFNKNKMAPAMSAPRSEVFVHAQCRAAERVASCTPSNMPHHRNAANSKDQPAKAARPHSHCRNRKDEQLVVTSHLSDESLQTIWQFMADFL